MDTSLRLPRCLLATTTLFASALGCAAPVGTTPAEIPSAWLESGDSTYFIQMADPQLGMWSTPMLYLLLGMSGDPDAFERGSADMVRAVAHANRLRPDFVVLCGDLTNVPGHAAQIAEFKRIAAQLDPSIPLYLVAGNHDVGNEPTPESLEAYRSHFGPDYYSFRAGNVYGIVLDSQLIHSPQSVAAEADLQLAWLRTELEHAKASPAEHILVFQHHPFFLTGADEKDGYFNIPSSRRFLYLDLLREAGVPVVFAGHYHRNAHGRHGELEMVTSGPVGRPLGDDPSGMRLVRASSAGIEHLYFSLDDVPASFRMAAEPRPRGSVDPPARSETSGRVD